MTAAPPQDGKRLGHLRNSFVLKAQTPKARSPEIFPHRPAGMLSIFDLPCKYPLCITIANAGTGSSRPVSPFRKRPPPFRQDQTTSSRSVSGGVGREAGGGRTTTQSHQRDDPKSPTSWWPPGSPLLRPIVKEGILKKRGGRINAWGDRFGVIVMFAVPFVVSVLASFFFFTARIWFS